MKKLLLSSLTALTVVACSNTTPPTNKLAKDLTTIPEGTVISANATEELKIPKDNQSLVKLSKFRVGDNIYTPDGKQLLIPRGAFIAGLYTNTGTDCKISWKGIAYNKDNLKDNKVSTNLTSLTETSSCEPDRAIEKGDRVTIKFKPENKDSLISN